MDDGGGMGGLVLCLSVWLGLAWFGWYVIRRWESGSRVRVGMCVGCSLVTLLLPMGVRGSVGGTSLYLFLLFAMQWMATQRMMAYSIGVGPMAEATTWVEYVMGYMLLVRVRTSPSGEAISHREARVRAVKSLASGAGLYAIVALLLKYWGPYLEGTVWRYPFYALLIYLGATGGEEIASGLYLFMSRKELLRSFDHPFLSDSIEDFWGRRWNILVSNLLKETIYFPVQKAVMNRLGKHLASVAAVFMSFLVSGLAHELLMYSASGQFGTDQMTFFLLQALLLTVEKSSLGRQLRHTLLPYRFLRILTTLIILLATSPIFFNGIGERGIIHDAIQDVRTKLSYLTHERTLQSN